MKKHIKYYQKPQYYKESAGRICPHQKQCQGSCVRGIKGEPVSIGELEAFVFDKVADDEESLVKCYKDENENINKSSLIFTLKNILIYHLLHMNFIMLKILLIISTLIF